MVSPAQVLEGELHPGQRENLVIARQKGLTLDCRFAVTDSGIGISSRQMADIFTAFTQADGVPDAAREKPLVPV